MQCVACAFAGHCCECGIVDRFDLSARVLFEKVRQGSRGSVLSDLFELYSHRRRPQLSPQQLRQQPPRRANISGSARAGGIHGRGAGAEYDAKEPARGCHRRCHGAIALKLLLEA